MFDSRHSLSLSLSLGFEFSHFSNRLLCFPRFVTDLHRSRIKLFCVLFVRVCVSLIDLHFWIEDLCNYFLGFWFGGLVCRIVEKWRSSTQPWALSTRRPSRRRGGSSGDSLLRSTALLSCSASRTISLSLSLSISQSLSFNGEDLLLVLTVYDVIGGVQVALSWYLWPEDKDRRSIRNHETRSWAQPRSQQWPRHRRQALGAHQGAIPHSLLRRFLPGTLIFI